MNSAPACWCGSEGGAAGELGVVGVQRAVSCGEVEALEQVARRLRIGPVRQAQPLSFSCDGDRGAPPAVDEEVLEADAEDHGDAEQCGQRGKQLAALDLRQQRGGQPGVLGELHLPHALPQAQGADLRADFVAREAGRQRLGKHGPSGFTTGASVRFFLVGKYNFHHKNM